MNTKFKVASGVIAIAVAGAGIYLSQGTNAKYTTGGNGTDQARIAKWHIDNLNVDLNLFNDEYTNGDGDVTVKSHASTPDNVIAPGTSGTKTLDFNDLDADNQSEVAYKVKIDSLKISNTNGLPILYNLTIGNGPKSEDLNGDKLMDAIKDVALDFDADGQPTGTTNDGTIKIDWKWAFDAVDDQTDTYVGTNKSDYAADGVILDLDYSATQTN
ncbi:MAG: hypothetical protein LBT80_08375 [Lactobacillaceae bacterium]|jgi:hypothetical protein|nr:hypothetical protein [Lactobacillaceae bacterium]